MHHDRLYEKQGQVAPLHKIILCLIVLFGVALTYYPHINYQFPLHVDEWYHIYEGQYIAQHGPSSINVYTRAFSYPDTEQGFHILLAGIVALFNPSITAWIYLPAMIDVLAILSVFIFVRKLFSENEALIAAFLVALMPSNVTIGGPVFLIPANLALIFIPLALLFAFDLLELKPLKNYACIFLITTFVLYAHPPTAGILIFALLVYAGLNLFSKVELDRKKAMYLLATIILSGIASLPNYLLYLHVKSGIANAITFSFFTSLSQVPYLYGFIPTILFLIGFFIISGDNDKKTLTVMITSLFLLVIIMLFANFGVNFLIPYQRVYISLFLIMSIIGSKGLYKILDANRFVKYSGTAAFVLLIALTAYFSISNDISTPYYHIINNSEYSNFLWIKANLNNNATVLLDPWLAKAFGPVTDMRVYSVIPFSSPNATISQMVNSTYAFLASNCTNTTFMKENNISIVYSESGCRNSNLTEVHNDTYVLK